MQISEGTVAISSLTPTLVQGTDVDWSQVLPGSLFIVSGQSFRINSVDAEAMTLNLSAPYVGASISGQTYVIVRDFSSNYGLPLLNKGDLEASAVFTRAMMILDSLLGSAVSASSEIPLTKTAHGFRVGNALRFNGSTIELATSASAAASAVFGIVSSVTDANNFKILTNGRVTNIAGITLTAGKIYYLRSSPLLINSGDPSQGYTNIIDDSSGAWTHTGTLHVPVIIADGVSSGYIVNFAAVSSGAFGLLRDGAVPGPTQADIDAGKVLSAAGSWILASIGNYSVASQHLYAGGAVDWTAFAQNPVAGNLSLLLHIRDLHTRLAVLEQRGLTPVSVRLTRGNTSYTVPSGVSKLRVRWRAGLGFTFTGGNRSPLVVTGLSSAIEIVVVIAVTTGDQLVFSTELPSLGAGLQYGYGSSSLYAGQSAFLKKNGTTVLRLGSDAWNVVGLSHSSAFVSVHNFGRGIHIYASLLPIFSVPTGLNTEVTSVVVQPCPLNLLGGSTATAAQISSMPQPVPGIAQWQASNPLVSRLTYSLGALEDFPGNLEDSIVELEGIRNA